MRRLAATVARVGLKLHVFFLSFRFNQLLLLELSLILLHQHLPLKLVLHLVLDCLVLQILVCLVVGVQEHGRVQLELLVVSLVRTHRLGVGLLIWRNHESVLLLLQG